MNRLRKLLCFILRSVFLYNSECADYLNCTKPKLFLETLVKELGINCRLCQLTKIVVLCKFVSCVVYHVCFWFQKSCNWYKQVAQLLLTNPRDALHHDKRQNVKTVT